MTWAPRGPMIAKDSIETFLSMTTITLTLTPYQEARLLDAMSDQVHVWRKIRLEAIMGDRPNASPEGAEMLIQDALAVQSMIVEQIKANREAG